MRTAQLVASSESKALGQAVREEEIVNRFCLQLDMRGLSDRLGSVFELYSSYGEKVDGPVQSMQGE